MSGMMPWMRRSDDELISAYLDGQLDDAGHRVFEERIASDATLRRKVNVTRTMMSVARQLPRVDAAHNFIVPHTIAKPEFERSTRLVWRIGSALAAAVFVMTLGLQAIGFSQLSAAPLSVVADAPLAATSNSAENTGAELPNESAGGQLAAKLAVEATTVTDVMTASIESAPPAPLPTAAQAFLAAPLSRAAEITPEAELTLEAEMTPNATTSEPDEITHGGLSVPALEQDDTQTNTTAPAFMPIYVLRIASIVALGIAIIAGVLGWVVKRET